MMKRTWVLALHSGCGASCGGRGDVEPDAESAPDSGHGFRYDSPDRGRPRWNGIGARRAQCPFAEDRPLPLLPGHRRTRLSSHARLALRASPRTHHATADVHLLELRDAAVARSHRDVLERHVERVLGCWLIVHRGQFIKGRDEKLEKALFTTGTRSGGRVQNVKNDRSSAKELQRSSAFQNPAMPIDPTNPRVCGTRKERSRRGQVGDVKW